MLIVGLGNPGDKYSHTRHNAGFWLLDELAKTHRVSLKLENKFSALYAKANIDGVECHLLMPMTFMNKSGISIQSCANFFKITPERILVAHDELDLPAGEVKLKFAGGHGGHNGLRDTLAHLGTADFYRLRIGIGHPGHKDLVLNYVLGPPGSDEKIKIDVAIERGLKVMPLIVANDLHKAMHALHTKI